MDPIVLVALAVGLLVASGVVVAVAMRTGRPGGPGPTGAVAVASAPRWPIGPCWEAAGPLLEAMGLSKLTAESYRRELDGLSETLYVRVQVPDASLAGWLNRPCPGGAVEQFLGADAELKPGEPARSDLARFAAGAVGELMATLPRAARFTVKAPEIPGDKYEARLATPFSTPEQAPLLARVLLAFDEAARRPSPAGAHVRLPPVAIAWQAAAPMLEALGLSKLTAASYRRELDGLSETLYLEVDVRDVSVAGWLNRPCPGGGLEQFLGANVELKPGEHGRSDLARFAAGAVGELMAALPQAARLTVKAPEIPGDKSELRLATPFTAPEQAALVVRVLLALDAAARRPSAAGAHAHLPPVAIVWQAAAPLLEAMGLTKLSAESYWRQLAGLGEALYVQVQVSDATVAGWLKRPCPGGALERYTGAKAELTPGERGGSDLARFVVGVVGEALGALPGAARLSIEAPEIPGDTYKMRLATPFTAPDQAALVARVLLALDDAARRPSG